MREPTRLPVFLRAWRSGSKVRALIAVAMLASAGSASAKIGESYAQVLEEARQDKDALAITPWDNDGKPTLRVQYRNKDIIHHEFSTQGREIGFYWYANHEVTWKEVGVIQRVFKTKWHREQIHPQWTTWVSRDGMLLAVQGKELRIVHPEALSEKHEAGLHRAQTAQEEPNSDFEPLTPAATPSFASEPAPNQQNDCLPFAVEAFARMKNTAYWAKIGGFVWVQNGKKIGGHAVLFFQPTEKSNVHMYDRSGSYDLGTQSHDLGDIIAALNQLTRNNISVESPEWLENNDSQTQFASSTSAQQPVWSKPGTTTAEGTAQPIGAIILIMAVTAFGVFLRYAGVRLWPIAILSEPVYLMIEAIRHHRKYGPQP